MKRARYLLGAAGLAPVALGLAAPAAAHATAAAPGRGKMVSLHHSGMHTATLLAAKAVSAAGSTSSGNGTTTGGCTGNTKVNVAKDGHVKGQLWYANNWDDSYTCIGTVDASLYYSHNDCKTATVTASYQGNAYFAKAWGPETKTVCGTDGHWTVEPFGIHTDFKHLPDVSGMHVYISSQFGGFTGAQFGS
jgi:hypothetical protein